MSFDNRRETVAEGGGVGGIFLTSMATGESSSQHPLPSRGGALQQVGLEVLISGSGRSREPRLTYLERETETKKRVILVERSLL